MTPRDGLLRDRTTPHHREPRRTGRWLHALRDHLVAPPPSPPPLAGREWEPPRPRDGDWAPPSPTAAVASLPPVIAVIADRRDIATLAAGVALLVAATHRAPCAVVVLDATPHPRGVAEDAPRQATPLAAPAARRLSTSLMARGLDARAAGRVVTATLPVAEDASPPAASGLELPAAPDSAGAVAVVERVLAASGGAGAVTVVGLGTPRAAGLDRALAACDIGLVLVRPGQERVLDLAVDGLVATGIPARGAVARVRPSARLLAGRGLLVTPGLRATLAPLLAGRGAGEDGA